MPRWWAGLALAVFPVVAHAQTVQCHIPSVLQRPAPIVPRTGEARPNLPVGGYTLALSWSPEHCAQRYDNRHDTQCSGTIGSFGFILHGLWPEGTGRNWPQFCRPAAVLPREVIAANLCVMPSAQLMQHQWAKHGTCVTARPQEYFDIARRLYQQIRLPDMAALARNPRLTAGGLLLAVAARNPGMKPDMMRVRATRDGWLDEIWICLDRRYARTSCPAHKGGMRAAAPVRIRL